VQREDRRQGLRHQQRPLHIHLPLVLTVCRDRRIEQRRTQTRRHTRVVDEQGDIWRGGGGGRDLAGLRHVEGNRHQAPAGACREAGERGGVPCGTEFLYNFADAIVRTKTSYSDARQNFATLWDQVEDSREAAIIQRRGHVDMALIPADELASVRETAYLLRSPQNAVRLLAALTRARRGTTTHTDLAALRRELDLAEEP
jgi:antitoxin YefM